MANTRQPDPVRVILRYNGTEHICKQMPIGWRDQSASWEFNFKQFGYGLKYAPDSMRFAKEDADFIRQCIDRSGISTAIDITVQHRQNNWTFKDTWKGQTRLEDGYVNEVDFFEVKIVEGGLKRAIDKNGKTNFDMPFDDDAIDIQVLNGMALYENVKFNEDKLTFRHRTSSLTEDFHFICIIDEQNSFMRSKDLIFHSQITEGDGREEEIILYPFLRTLNYSGTDNTTREIVMHFNFSAEIYGEYIDTTQPIPFYIKETKRDGTIVNHNLYNLDPSSLNIGSYTDFQGNTVTYVEGIVKFNVDFSVILSTTSNSEYIFSYTVTFLKNPTLGRFSNIKLDITFFGEITTDLFNFKAYKAQTFGQKLLDKIHSGATFEVPFLQQMEQSENMQLFITSADAIRGIQPTEKLPQGALIKTNFNEFKEQLDKLFSTGEQCSVKDNFYRILHKADIFSNNELINLGNVKKMQIVQPDDDWLINNIKVGYAKQDYNYPLGRQEFAVTLEFDNQLNVDSKTLDLVSKYRADYTGVHLLHYAYVNSDKKDSKSDNDVFFILAYGTSTKSITAPFDNITIEDILVSVGQNVSKGQPLFVFEVQKLYNTVTADDDCKILSINVNVGDVLSAGSIILTVSYNDWTATQGDRVTHIDGLDGGGYFNILLSPKTMLISHARFFASLLDKHAKILRYTSSTETMSALEYTDTELGHVVEKADLSVANAEPFFKPFIFMFNCVVPVSLSEIMGETPCGYFTFEYNNLILKGFPVDIQGSYTNSEQIVKCIAHPATPDNIQEILHKRLPNKLYK